MSGCGCGCSGDGMGGPYSKGRELVEFVYNAHGGGVRDQLVKGGPLQIRCQGCEQSFAMVTYVSVCPACGGVHAVAPLFPTAENVQFAGSDFSLP